MSGVTKVRLCVGTKRGLFVARTDMTRSAWQLEEPQLVGREVYHIAQDAGRGRIWATTRHAVWGAHLHYSEDWGRTWEIVSEAPHHEDGRGVHAIWCVTPTAGGRLYAGIEPAGLFYSDDGGGTWHGSSLNARAAADGWQPAGGSLALHSIVTDAVEPGRMWCAVSAGGVYRSDDGGETWQAKNRGTRAEFLPQTRPESGQCVHKLIAHPARSNRLYQQSHCGTYRSDDGGDSWVEITEGLPSDFGYVLATDVRDANCLYVVPEESSHLRTTANGRLRVYRTRDGGGSWTALTRGLPQQNVYVSLLREAMTNDTLEPPGVYFGTSSGHVFASAFAGENWGLVASYLPRVLSLCAVVTTE
jgi:photosystem II stability/assembly factor-like uncharacterized protein